MVTIYDLLEVSEKASKEEIEKAYTSMIVEYQMNPNLSEQENKENEMILNKLKIAYGILSNEEKRKKYDADLAKKRAEELIKNVTVSQEITPEEELEPTKTVEEKVPIQDDPSLSTHTGEIVETNETHQIVEPDDDDVVLTKEEQKRVRNAAKKEFKQNLKKVKKAEEEYNQAYNEAYNNYLRKLGYQVKEPWTLKRVRNTVVGILIIVAVCALIWFLPPTRQILVDFYNENYIVKALVDIVKALIDAILGIFE